ncbi:adenine phosphoribosyltransferase [uncultured Jatrophihabitans sp.]|uniref:adenine phosphoribosyltransferase n=1 Tax=uncultured Jatrophihabitans sp. TaxID=1610747 RepID=UPI0035C967E7
MTSDPRLARRIEGLLRDVPDFPKPGIVFKDITPLLADADAFAATVSGLAESARAAGGVDLVAGVEARGFLMAGALATELGCGLLPVRKAGKLPPPVKSVRYDLEYGSAEIEVPHDIAPGSRVLLVDDVLATGGTLRAAAQLLTEIGAEVVALAVILELADLHGRDVLADVAPLDALLSV